MHTFNMMRKRLRFWFVTMMLALMSQSPLYVTAQNPQTIEVGPHFGVTSYVGELNTWRNLLDWDWKSFNQFDYDLGAVVRFNYDSRWSFRLDYTYGKFRASDHVAAWRPEALLSFKSTVHDIGLLAEFNFLNYYTGRIESAFSPYIFAGISGLMYNSQPYSTDPILGPVFETLSFRDDLKTEGVEYGKYALSVPFGIGCKLSLSQHLAATLEWRMHYTFTDYLDDVSGVYPADGNHRLLVTDANGNMALVNKNPDNLEAMALVYDFTDPSGLFKERQQRGNHANNDWFGMINLSITWKFVIPGNSACKMNIE